MADVFLAHDKTRKPVVIKKILPQYLSQPAYLKMFKEEFEILSLLQSDGVVRVIETHETYAAIEFVDGLDWRVTSQYFIPQPIINYFFVEALSILSLVHNAGIVHRDISPQNWMIGYDGKVKLLDFGISKFEDRTHETVTGVLKGKYSYMSPEQAAGQSVTLHSDLFSMGVILYELSTRKRLFKRANDFLTLQAIGQCEIQIPDYIDRDLGCIIQKALSKNFGNRFQSCEEFRNALIEYAQATGRLAERQEVIDFFRFLPKPRQQLLFEATRIERYSKSQMVAGFGALALALFGLNW